MIVTDHDPNHLDELTRYRMKDNISDLIDNTTRLAFLFGVIIGIIIASFLHKYIVHPLGW